MPPEDNATETGLTEAVGPPEGAVALRVTLPERPLRLVRVIVEVPEDPCTTLRLVGLEDMLKSGPTTVTAVVAERDGDPPIPVPVTVMVYVPAGVEVVVEIMRVDVPVPPAVKVTGFTLKEKLRLVTGEAARFTLPAKLFRLVNVMVEVAELPATKLAGVAALAEMLKSGAGGDWTMNLPNIGPLCMKHQYVYVPGFVVAVKGNVVPVDPKLLDRGSPGSMTPFPL